MVVKAVGSGGTRIGSPYYDKYPGAYKRPVRPGAGTERIEQGAGYVVILSYLCGFTIPTVKTVATLSHIHSYSVHPFLTSPRFHLLTQTHRAIY